MNKKYADMTPVEVLVIQALYKDNDFPSDQLFKNDPAIRGFTLELNRRLGCTLTPSEVQDRVEYIRKNKRTTGGLPRLGRAYRGPKYTDN